MTVIATGFRYAGDVTAGLPLAAPGPVSGPRPHAGSPAMRYPPAAQPAPPAAETAEPTKERVPFYRKVLAQGTRGDDPGGFGPNWSAVDDYDIPTVLRKQMD